jgi:hypothetical protein
MQATDLIRYSDFRSKSPVIIPILHEIGRAQFGRISIANSDSEAYAYLDAAVDAGWRAVAEQTT